MVDALGRQMELQKPPARIVSLVPSLTELLFDLGVKPIAASDYCLHPSYELEKLPREVRNYEPRRAFASGPDGLSVIRQLLREGRPTFGTHLFGLKSGQGAVTASWSIAGAMAYLGPARHGIPSRPDTRFISARSQPLSVASRQSGCIR